MYTNQSPTFSKKVTPVLPTSVSGGPGQPVASGESALAAFAADGVDLIDEDDGGSLGQQTLNRDGNGRVNSPG